ncbi:MAG TPA: thioredoxin family protein [Gemmatimonadaceae bacterium]|nr:thioredoxin family protein [Gemmatimonadaceae bacterium]
MTRRKIDFFSAGCPLCEEALRTVRDVACDSCDITVLDMKSDAGKSKARGYGVKRVPAVAVDGQLADCCHQGEVNAETLRGLGVGVAR